MRKVSAYETTDGLVFTDKQEAERHQQTINFRDWYQQDGNTLYGDYAGSKVEWDDLLTWLEDNKQTILNILK